MIVPVEPRPRILIVEDSEATALSLQVLFHRRRGWGSVVAADGTEARLLLEEQPEAVLLDLMLPDIPGEDLIGEIRDRCPSARVVVLTALIPSSPRMVRVASMKPDAIVHKPFELEDLMSAVTGIPATLPTIVVEPPAGPPTTG